MFFLVSSLLSFLLFPIHGTCAEGNSKNGSSEDTSKNIFRDRKKYKNYKTKNVSSQIQYISIFLFPTLYIMFAMRKSNATDTHKSTEDQT